MITTKIEEMCWPEIKEALEKGFDTIIVAVGSNEQHGPHLPTITDTMIGNYLVDGAVKKLGCALQGPTISIGCSDHHLTFPGTISISAETLKMIVHDYIRSVSKHNFKNLVFIPSHGGNFKPLEDAIVACEADYPKINILRYTNLQGFINQLYDLSEKEGILPSEAGAHAGENETSMMLQIADHLVNKSNFASGFTGKIGEKETETLFAKGMTALTKNGVLGDPAKASKDKGKRYLDGLIDFLVSELKIQLK